MDATNVTELMNDLREISESRSVDPLLAQLYTALVEMRALTVHLGGSARDANGSFRAHIQAKLELADLVLEASREVARPLYLHSVYGVFTDTDVNTIAHNALSITVSESA